MPIPQEPPSAELHEDYYACGQEPRGEPSEERVAAALALLEAVRAQGAGPYGGQFAFSSRAESANHRFSNFTHQSEWHARTLDEALLAAGEEARAARKDRP